MQKCKNKTLSILKVFVFQTLISLAIMKFFFTIGKVLQEIDEKR